MNESSERLRDELLEEGHQILGRMTSARADPERSDLHLNEVVRWSERVLDWAALSRTRVPLPGSDLRLVDMFTDERSFAYVERTVAVLGGSVSESVDFPIGRAFVSYVREDTTAVARLVDELKEYGARIWLDRNDLRLGVDWKESIRKAVAAGSYFLWCNSVNSARKERSYANEELNLAIEELRLRSADQTWFIPVKLTEIELPDREIGGGRRLSDLQWVDLSADWNKGVLRIAELVARLTPRQMTLIASLDSPDRRERAETAELLYGAPDPQLVVPLCELVRRADAFDTAAVYWAGGALARIRNPRAVPVLIEAVIRGVGREYKLIENLESFKTDEAMQFVSQFRETEFGLDRIVWLEREGKRRGVQRHLEL